MSRFEATFKALLKEAIEDNKMERDAMEKSLDPNINPKDFDTDVAPNPDEITDDEVSDAFSRKNQQTIDEIQSWIDQVDTFLTFLNGENPESIQSRLAAAEPDTVMDKMKQSQQTKISRVASDLASLHQSLLGFMAQTKNSKFKYI